MARAHPQVLLNSSQRGGGAGGVHGALGGGGGEGGGEWQSQSGSDQPPPAVPGAGPWEDHSPSLVASWSTWPAIHSPACAGKLLAMCWRSSWALFRWTSLRSNFLPSESSWI